MPKKVLVVDDEPEIVDLAEALLKENGYEVIHAGDGWTALERAKKENPDLLLLDLMLPKMDGYKVASLLKKDTRYARIPILILTAKAGEDDQKLAHQAGADACLPAGRPSSPSPSSPSPSSRRSRTYPKKSKSG